MGASAIHGTTGADATRDIPGGTQSIQRAVAVLRILATARETGLGLTEISVQAALPHPTAHRILRILIAEGIVSRMRCSMAPALTNAVPRSQLTCWRIALAG